jgi:SSS family solute:Na+ symporter
MGPNLATVDVVIIVGFLVAVTVVGYVLSRVASSGIEDYFLGGNKIPWWVLGISTATSNFDMSGTMIIVAVVFGLGYKGFLVEFRGGVGLSLALLLVFLGKWLRRSRVMTSAEWMKLRFGTDKQGRAAHLLSAVANILLSLGMIVYFSKGAGKFLTYFLPFDEVTCTAAMVGVGLFYTLLSGLYGVVFTDVIQMLLLTFTAIFVTVEAFAVAPTVTLPDGLLDLNLEPVTTAASGALVASDGAWSGIFEFFGICVVMWFMRSILEGMGGVGGYTDQRFFAARNEREAGLLTLESIVLSLFRWTMVAGLVVMGYKLIQDGGVAAELIAQDPEQVLPVVLGELLPAGIRGVVLAGLIAAAMSTFDSTLNAGASYLVKDIYQSYVRPDATGEQLMKVSRWATIGLCVAGVGLAAIVPNINRIWGLITMGLGAGLFVPLVLRWYWPRFNGFGFAAGTAGGIVAGMVFNAALSWPIYLSFPAIVGTAFVASIVGSLLSAPTPDRVLVDFVVQINPWGFWRRYENLALEQKQLTPKDARARTSEKLNDMLALCFSLPFQISMLLMAMAFVFHDWKTFGTFFTIWIVSMVGLYFFWYRGLKDVATCRAEDVRFGWGPEHSAKVIDDEDAPGAEVGPATTKA